MIIKMKAIKFICAAMVCGALAVGFSSCSKDDDGPNNMNQREWVLVSISCHSSGTWGDGGGWSMNVDDDFNYDSSGRVVEDGDDEVTYVYSSDQILNSDGEKFSLNGNGHIASINRDGDTDYVRYDDKGNLVEYKTDHDRSILDWSNGLLRRIQAWGTEFAFEYSESTPMNIDCVRVLNSRHISYDALDGYWALYFMGYFGNIPSKPICGYTMIRDNCISCSKETASIYYKDIDSNGCPAKMIVNRSQGNLDAEYVYDLVWRKL